MTKSKGDSNINKYEIILISAILIVIAIIVSKSLISVSILDNPNVLDSYSASDSELLSTIEYYGFLNPSDNWYILRYNLTDGAIRYNFGSTNYNQSWFNRTNLNYTLFNEAYN